MNISLFKNGIFSLRTRRFGTVAEYMMTKLLQEGRLSGKSNYDLTDKEGNRIEVKFSTVRKRNEVAINENNILQQILNSTSEHNMVVSNQVDIASFDCNIQQVKPNEFDVLYYGLFFQDKIAIFKISNSEVLNMPTYCNKQHRGNVGEGQFHINNKTVQYHIDNFLFCWLSYEELYNLFKQHS